LAIKKDEEDEKEKEEHEEKEEEEEVHLNFSCFGAVSLPFLKEEGGLPILATFCCPPS
jgi:hypothetical protein